MPHTLYLWEVVTCLYVNNVLYVYNCIHEKAIKPSCILYLVTVCVIRTIKSVGAHHTKPRIYA